MAQNWNTNVLENVLTDLDYVLIISRSIWHNNKNMTRQVYMIQCVKCGCTVLYFVNKTW
jgi:hypothetical protein